MYMIEGILIKKKLYSSQHPNPVQKEKVFGAFIEQMAV